MDCRAWLRDASLCPLPDLLTGVKEDDNGANKLEKHKGEPSSHTLGGWAGVLGQSLLGSAAKETHIVAERYHQGPGHGLVELYEPSASLGIVLLCSRLLTSHDLPPYK